MQGTDYISLAFGVVGFVVSIASIGINYYYNKKLEAYKKDLEDKQRRLVRYEDVQELMVQYKKPLVQSAFDLQSRLAQQVTNNILRTFGRQDKRRSDFARYSMAFLLCEFLGWLEVIRQEIVFVTGKDAETLNQILDAIKFQLTGDQPFHGVPDKNATKRPDVDTQDWTVMQLFGVELRAIGEVMIRTRDYDDDKEYVKNTGLSVIGFAEFTRRVKGGEQRNCIRGPKKSDDDASEQDQVFRDTIEPLMRSIDRLMEMDNPPKERMALMQVLLCCLIDFLDTDPEGMGDFLGKRYLPRDMRLMPVIEHLKPDALKWLATRPFMKDCEEMVEEQYRATWARLVDGTETWRSPHWPLEVEPVSTSLFRTLAFPGFGQGLDINVRHARFPGAFPPARKRTSATKKAVKWAWNSGKRISMPAIHGALYLIKLAIGEHAAKAKAKARAAAGSADDRPAIARGGGSGTGCTPQPAVAVPLGGPRQLAGEERLKGSTAAAEARPSSPARPEQEVLAGGSSDGAEPTAAAAAVVDAVPAKTVVPGAGGRAGPAPEIVIQMVGPK